jgi:HD-GYP domain-containing protein (c-di-GMP phosphodiesterase class II)
MRLIPISTVLDQIKVGHPLPWGIYNKVGVLLLARGLNVTNTTLQSALIARGAFVDAAELESSPSEHRQEETPLDAFISCWDRLIYQIRNFSIESDAEGLVTRVGDCLKHTQALMELNPDLLIFMILQQDQSRFSHYSFFHALHVAAICGLATQRLGWEQVDRASVMSAALTMNLSIAKLQGVLAMQRTPLTAQQKAEIRQHPVDSAEMLRKAGVTDANWLTVVEQHHEVPGGGGYPLGLSDPFEMSQLLHYVDIYAAKLSMRATRLPVLPKRAAHVLFTGNSTNPLVAAVIKEFGLYPPGSYVRLVSGEIAIVMRRGPTAATPVVVALTNAQGYALGELILRETVRPAYAVADAVAEADIRVRPPWKALYEISFT